jgi:hypothetical protein
MRTTDAAVAAVRTSRAHGHEPWQVSEDDDHNRRRGRRAATSVKCKCLEHQVFKDCLLPCPKHIEEAAVAHLRVATIFVAEYLTRTSFERMYGQLLQLPHQDLLRTRDKRVGAGEGSTDPARTLTGGAAPTTPPGGVIEPHATMEYGRVSRAAPLAGPGTAARMCGPVGPARAIISLGLLRVVLRPWAVPPEDVPEDEPDVLY